MADKQRRPSPRDDTLAPVELPGPEDTAHFNALEDGDQADQESLPKRSNPWWRLVALVAAVSLLAWAGSQLLTYLSWPNLDFLQESSQLKDERQLAAVEAAVVEIQAFASAQQGGSRRGTGFNVLSSGLVVTNRHLLEDAWNAVISFPDGTDFMVSQWALHPDADLAVIDLESHNLPAVPVQLHQYPVPGDTLTVLGNPLGFSRIAVDARALGFFPLHDGSADAAKSWVLVLEGPVYPGSSGSPVLNQKGQAVGVIYATANQGDTILGLAVPMGEIEQIW